METLVSVSAYSHGGWKVVLVAVLLMMMQILMVMGRLVSRKLKKVALAADDYVLLLAAALTIGLCTLAVAFPRIAGAGPHISNIQEVTTSEGTLIGQRFMAWEILYGASIAVSKCAILLLYIRVFTTCKKAFTVTAYIAGIIIIATGIANTAIAVLQCSPQSFAYDKSMEGGTCIDEIARTRYMAIPNVVTGAVMIIMPLPIVWKLKVNLSAKIALTATFLHGIIGFIASCARLTILFSTNTTHFSNTISLTWTIWTINEAANYIIAASLPTLRPIFIRILPSSFFILSHKNNSKSPTSFIKCSWPKGSLAPRFYIGTRRCQTNGQITGPWDRPWGLDGEEGGWIDVEGGRRCEAQFPAGQGKKGGVSVRTSETRLAGSF